MIRFIKEKIALRKFRKQDEHKTKELKSMFIFWDLLNENKIEKFDKLMNVCAYVSLANRDIYYLAEDFYFQKDRNRKNFIGRLFCMSMIEYLDDIQSLLGHDLLIELKMNGMNHFSDEVKLLSKNYSKLKRDREKDFRKIRNNASAHKNRNARELVEIYESVPVDVLTPIGVEFGKLEHVFINISTKILLEILEQETVNNKEEKHISTSRHVAD